MQIQIIDDEDKLVMLSDNNLDNDNYVELTVNGEVSTIPIDELLSAVHAFEQLRIMRIARENNYKD